MRSYNGEIERVTTNEKESKFRKFAFNAMKKAKEGLMIVTFSAVMATGITSNVYGDENMASTTISQLAKLGSLQYGKVDKTEEKYKSKEEMLIDIKMAFQTMNTKSGCTEGVCILPETQAKLLNHFKTKNAKDEEVITGQTLVNKMNENKFLLNRLTTEKDKVFFKNVCDSISSEFGEVPITEINFEKINEKNVLLLYAAYFINYNEKSGFIEKKNILSDRTLNKDSDFKIVDSFFNYLAGKNMKGPASNQVTEEVPETRSQNIFRSPQVVNYNEKIKLDDTSIKTINDFDSEGIQYETKIEKGKTVWYVNPDDFKNYVDKKFNEGNRQDLVEDIENNPKNVETLMNEYDTANSTALSNEDRITLEKYAEMLKKLKAIYNKRDLGLDVTFSGQIYNWGKTTTGYYVGYSPKMSLFKGFEIDPSLIYGGLSLRHNINGGKDYISTTVGFQSQLSKESTVATASLGYGYEGNILNPYLTAFGTMGKGENIIYSVGGETGLKITPGNNTIDINATTIYGKKENTIYLNVMGKASYLYNWEKVGLGLFVTGGFNIYDYQGIENKTFSVGGGFTVLLPTNEWFNTSMTLSFTEEGGIQ